jgi:hypothetical protein
MQVLMNICNQCSATIKVVHGTPGISRLSKCWDVYNLYIYFNRITTAYGYWEIMPSCQQMGAL